MPVCNKEPTTRASPTPAVQVANGFSLAGCPKPVCSESHLTRGPTVNCFRHTVRHASALRAALMLGAALPILASAPQVVHAQDYTNVAASGRVTDEDGKAIAGATVSITSSARGVVRSAVTSDTGAYPIARK